MSGDMSGDVSGDMSGDVSGDLSGDVSGDLSGDVVLSVKNLSVDYAGPVHAVRRVSFELARGQVLAVKTEDYVEGARSIGLRHFSIITRYILPNVAAPILVQATLTIATAIIAEASLSFLGLGQQPPAASWGSMVGQGRDYMASAPWIVAVPALVIALVSLVAMLLGDPLRDRLDPRLRGR